MILVTISRAAAMVTSGASSSLGSRKDTSLLLLTGQCGISAISSDFVLCSGNLLFKFSLGFFYGL